jgi:CheY-like chemotaxis protein
LVAEDNKTNQKVIMRQLHLLGYAAELADNGREALSLWQNKHYGLVLTDCHMPEMDGFEFAAALRREEGCSGRHTPLVAITANVLKGEREHCLAAGMDDYLAKPVPLVALKDMLAKWLPAANAAVNPDALKEIVGDDPAIVAEFLIDFVLTAREAVGEIQVAYRARAAQEIAAFAHKLKSSARTVGADSLADLCQALEQAGKIGDWAAIDMSMPRLDPGFAAVEHFTGVFVGQEH